jgi:ferric iron reductase protein FhuF
MSSFLDTLRIQRWDDHRYYHHSLVNQSLHLLSAVSFVCAYLLMFNDPWLAALIGWLVSMTSRQMGHFFFEPRDYDVVNQATDEYKEAIKVGYNIRRKVVLMAVWAASPIALLLDPTMLGLVAAPRAWTQFAQHLGYLWLAVGVCGLLFRTVQLFLTRDVMTGLAWATKIITDPFHDIKLYYRAPLQLMRGGLMATTLSDDEPHETAEFFQ